MYKFIIETNTYAGNFNRELTAYVTGILGECKVGKGCIDKNFNYPLEFNEKIEQVRDDYGTYRPCVVHEYYSVIIFFNDEPSTELLNLMVSRAKEYAISNDIEIVKCNLSKSIDIVVWNT